MAKRPCRSYPACSNLVQSGYCDACKAKGCGKDARPSAAARGYDGKWAKASKAYLRAHPIAVDWFGTHQGRLYPAECVDHIIPHRGDKTLFWDRSNWQGLTKADHDRKTAMEDGGFGHARKSG